MLAGLGSPTARAQAGGRATPPEASAQVAPQASPLPDEPSPDGLPRRLVLALDGVPYGMFVQLQAEGHFAGFGPAARMVSSFPSLSGVSFAAIGGGAIPEGYQEMRYDPGTNQVVGNTLYTLSGRAHQNLPADNPPHSLAHRLVGYMAPYTMAMRDLGRIREELLASRKTGFVAYLAQSDVIMHVDGAVTGRAFLVELDAWLAALQADVRARTGRDLLVDLVSDHGSTLVKGKEVDLPRQLQRCGFRRKDAIDGPRDVAYSLAGIIGSVAVTARPESVESVATCLASADGVELVAVDRGARVGLLGSDGSEAELRPLPGTPERYAYRSLRRASLFRKQVSRRGQAGEHENHVERPAHRLLRLLPGRRPAFLHRFKREVGTLEQGVLERARGNLAGARHDARSAALHQRFAETHGPQFFREVFAGFYLQAPLQHRAAKQHVPEFAPERLHVREAVFRFLRQHPVQQRLGEREFERQPRRRFVHVLIRGLHGGATVEGRLLDQHFVKNDAKRILVGTTVHFAADRLLRAHVSRRAHHHALLGDAGSGVVLHPRDAEVGDHRRVGVAEEDVVGLDVPVDHAVVMGVLKGVGDLHHDADEVGEREPTGAHAFAENAAFQEFHHDVIAVVVLHHVVDADDIPMRQLRQRLAFGQEALFRFAARAFLPGQDLDGHLSVERFLYPEIDGGHAARAELALQLVARDIESVDAHYE
jgi:hypothetical protein